MSRCSFLVLLIACGTPTEPAGTPAPAPVQSAPDVPHGAPAASAAVPGGTVRETMDSGGYTYVRLDSCGSDVWVAGPESKVAVGDTVRIDGNMRMDGFHSPKLDRTFDSIVFARSITVAASPIDCSRVASAPASAPPHPTGSSPHPGSGAPHAMPASAATGRQGKVLETMESGGYRYAHVDYCGTQTWVAGPAGAVEVGQTVATGSVMPMRDFHSSTLDRTFAEIDFVTSLAVVDGEPACP
ncbi:MAG: hypothetical protein R3F61_02240 [Myxococcota bacterium]